MYLLEFAEYMRGDIYNNKEVEEVLKILENESNEYLKKVRDQSENSRSAAVSKLASLQYQYFDNLNSLLKNTIPNCLHWEESTHEEDQREAAFLYYEFVLDMAAQSIRNALITEIKSIK